MFNKQNMKLTCSLLCVMVRRKEKYPSHTLSVEVFSKLMTPVKQDSL